MYLSHLGKVKFFALYIETFECIYTKEEELWEKIRMKELMYFKNT